jgi:hypothetical protein
VSRVLYGHTDTSSPARRHSTIPPSRTIPPPPPHPLTPADPRQKRVACSRPTGSHVPLKAAAHPDATATASRAPSIPLNKFSSYSTGCSLPSPRVRYLLGARCGAYACAAEARHAACDAFALAQGLSVLVPSPSSCSSCSSCPSCSLTARPSRAEEDSEERPRRQRRQQGALLLRRGLVQRTDETLMSRNEQYLRQPVHRCIHCLLPSSLRHHLAGVRRSHVQWRGLRELKADGCKDAVCMEAWCLLAVGAAAGAAGALAAARYKHCVSLEASVAPSPQHAERERERGREG